MKRKRWVPRSAKKISATEGLWPAFLLEWERLRQETDPPVREAVVLVEGERDRAALRRLGLRAPILLVNNGRPLSAFPERLPPLCRRVIVLTDWDQEGGTLARRLATLLDDGVSRADLEPRRRLGRVLRGELTHVEGLDTWARRNAERAGAPLDHWLSSPRG